MKKFTLGCEHDHEFEGWFADGGAIQPQIDQGLLDCPYCGSTTLEKRLSAPNLSTPKTKARIAAEQANNSGAETAPPQTPIQNPSPGRHRPLQWPGRLQATEQRPCAWRCGPCTTKFRLSSQMSVMNLQLRRARSTMANLNIRIFTGPAHQKTSANWQKTA